MRAFLGSLFEVLLDSVPAAAISPQAQESIDCAGTECDGFENGEFDAGNAVTEIELRSKFGAGEAELVDQSEYTCSSAASLYGGSGGCMINFIVTGTVQA